MTDITKYVPLKRIVSYFLDENNKSSADFHKAWIIAFRALVELNFNIALEPETFRLPVNLGNMTVTLPAGYIKWTKIGVINSSGEVSFLKINNSLTKWRDNNPNRLANISPDIIDTDFSYTTLNPFFSNYYFGSMYTPLFGLGAGMVTWGDCTVDEVNNLIVLSPSYPYSDILVECLISPQQNEDYQIQIVCQESVIAFLNWKFKVGSEQDYYNRLIEARRKLKPITLQEIQQAIRENQKYSLKS